MQQIGGDRPLQITITQSDMITGSVGLLTVACSHFSQCGEEQGSALYHSRARWPRAGAHRRCMSIGDNPKPPGRLTASLLSFPIPAQGISLGIAVFTLTTMQKRCLAAPDSNTVDMKDPTVSPDGITVAFARASTLRVRDIFTVLLVVGVSAGLPMKESAFGILCGPEWKEHRFHI